MEKFWAKVNIKSNDDCWEWKGPRNYQGYGVFNHRNTTTRAHRKSWELTNGPIPEGMVICHKCDNPSCVNPNRLFVGTRADNNADMVSKGRQRHNPGKSHFPIYKGEKHPCAKLTQADVDRIRSLHDNGKYKNVTLAEIYNCNQRTIGHIVNRTRWNT